MVHFNFNFKLHSADSSDEHREQKKQFFRKRLNLFHNKKLEGIGEGMTLIRTVHHMYRVIWQNDSGISSSVIIGVNAPQQKKTACVTSTYQLETLSTGLALPKMT